VGEQAVDPAGGRAERVQPAGTAGVQPAVRDRHRHPQSVLRPGTGLHRTAFGAPVGTLRLLAVREAAQLPAMQASPEVANKRTAGASRRFFCRYLLPVSDRRSTVRYNNT